MAVLTVDLDDAASDGLTSLMQLLEESAKSSMKAADGTNALTQSMGKQTMIINKQVVGYTQLADTGIKAFAQLGTAGIHAYEAIEVASIRATATILSTTIKVAGSVATYAIITKGAVSIANAIWGDHSSKVKKVAAEHEESTDKMTAGTKRFAETAIGSAVITSASTAAIISGWKLAGTALEGYAGGARNATSATSLLGGSTYQAAKTFSGLWAECLGAELALKGYAVLLKNTGVTTEELADGTKKVTTNLDRLKDAFAGLTGDINADLKQSGQIFKEWWNTPIDLMPQIMKDAWKEIDASETRSTKIMIENIGLVRRGYNEMMVQFGAFVQQLDGPATEAMRKLRSEAGAMAKQQAELEALWSAQAEGIKLLGKVNDEVAAKGSARAEAERIASIKTIDGVNAEIAAVRAAAQIKIQAGQFTADAATDYQKKMEALAQKQDAIEKNLHSERAKRQKELMEFYDEEMAKADEHAKQFNALFDKQQKQNADAAKMRADLEATAQKAGFDVAQDGAKQDHEANKQRTSDQLKARGATEAQIKQQLAAMDKTYSESEHSARMAQIDEEAKAKRLKTQEERDELARKGLDGLKLREETMRIEAEEQKIQFERQKAQIAENARFAREQNQLNVKAHMTGEEEKLRAFRERIEKQKELDKKSVDGVDLNQVMQNTDPRKVFKQLQDNRVQEAQQARADKDIDLYKKAIGGDNGARKRFEANQRAAINQAKQNAQNDWQNGNVQDPELQKAQAQVGQQTIGAMQKQGQLNANQTQILTDQLKIIADQQNALATVAQVQQKIIAFQKGVKNQAVQTVTTVQNQQGSLN